MTASDLILADVPFYAQYDATMAFAIAACEVDDDFFTGPQLFEQLKKTEFQGASGYVSFNRTTGTRSAETVSYQIINAVVNPVNEAGIFTVSSQEAVQIETATKEVRELRPFIYFDGTATPPLILPDIENEELNLMSTGVKVAGLTFACIVMAMSVAWFVWTIWNRKKPVVKASQPAFLCMLCDGTLIMASCIIPSSLQEPVSDRGLDIACMSTLWLFSVGFVTSFSALFSKTWRLNQVRPTSQLDLFFFISVFGFSYLTHEIRLSSTSIVW